MWAGLLSLRATIPPVRKLIALISVLRLRAVRMDARSRAALREVHISLAVLVGAVLLLGV